jgi:putative transposase
MRTYILPFAEPDSQIRLMFMDEASFGRISEPSYCWCPAGIRPIVPCHRIREYVYVFGAVDPINGDSSFIIAPKCNTQWTNLFLKTLSNQFANDYILLCTDCASWHKSKELDIPDNIIIFYLPQYTPEMNPIEQIWREVRKDGFKNTLFSTLDKVVDKLCDSLVALSNNLIMSVCAREWIASMFNGN